MLNNGCRGREINVVLAKISNTRFEVFINGVTKKYKKWLAAQGMFGMVDMANVLRCRSLEVTMHSVSKSDVLDIMSRTQFSSAKHVSRSRRRAWEHPKHIKTRRQLSYINNIEDPIAYVFINNETTGKYFIP